MNNEITKLQVERIGLISDIADNYINALSLPLPPQVHLESVAKGLTEIRDELRKIYREIAREDPWQGMN